MFQRVFAETVREIQDLVAGRPVLQARLRLRSAAFLFAPLVTKIEVEVLLESEANLSDVIGCLVEERWLTRQGNVTDTQVACLADRCGDQLAARA